MAAGHLFVEAVFQGVSDHALGALVGVVILFTIIKVIADFAAIMGDHGPLIRYAGVVAAFGFIL